MIKRIVLAYSGGLDTSVILTWLKETYQVPVVAFIADVGQGEDLKAVARKAARTGADAVQVTDLRDEFVRGYVFTALKANAVYEGSYLMGTSIARPLIARSLVEAALNEGADALAHQSRARGGRPGLAATRLDP